jgi:hypothetical protein
MEYWWEDKGRKPIRIRVKREVYKRAKAKCEKCKKIGLDSPDKKGGFKGHYHHIKSPSISPTAKTVRLLCPTCHERYGHSRKTVRHEGLIETTKEMKIKRHEVVKLKGKKKPKTKRVAIRSEWTGEVIGYKTVKLRPRTKKKTTKKKSPTKRKTPTKKKPTRKKISTKRRTPARRKATRKKKATKRKVTTKKKSTKSRTAKKKTGKSKSTKRRKK